MKTYNSFPYPICFKNNNLFVFFIKPTTYNKKNLLLNRGKNTSRVFNEPKKKGGLQM